MGFWLMLIEALAVGVFATIIGFCIGVCYRQLRQNVEMGNPIGSQQDRIGITSKGHSADHEVLHHNIQLRLPISNIIEPEQYNQICQAVREGVMQELRDELRGMERQCSETGRRLSRSERRCSETERRQLEIEQQSYEAERANIIRMIEIAREQILEIRPILQEETRQIVREEINNGQRTAYNEGVAELREMHERESMRIDEHMRQCEQNGTYRNLNVTTKSVDEKGGTEGELDNSIQKEDTEGELDNSTRKMQENTKGDSTNSNESTEVSDHLSDRQVNANNHATGLTGTLHQQEYRNDSEPSGLRERHFLPIRSAETELASPGKAVPPDHSLKVKKNR